MNVPIDFSSEAWQSSTRSYPTLKFFAYSHLPTTLQKVSEPFCRMALDVALENRSTIVSGTAYMEADVCIRKLLEAKDCAVRAALSR